MGRAKNVSLFAYFKSQEVYFSGLICGRYFLNFSKKSTALSIVLRAKNRSKSTSKWCFTLIFKKIKRSSVSCLTHYSSFVKINCLTCLAQSRDNMSRAAYRGRRMCESNDGRSNGTKLAGQWTRILPLTRQPFDPTPNLCASTEATSRPYCGPRIQPTLSLKCISLMYLILNEYTFYWQVATNKAKSLQFDLSEKLNGKRFRRVINEEESFTVIRLWVERDQLE